MIAKGHPYYNKSWYGSYRSMICRCYRKKNPNYEQYGGRGIVVYDEWLDIRNFEKWVKESNYKEGLTLDRIDVNGNYEPSNCKWSTMKEQGNNRTNTIYIEYNGEIHTLTEWSEITKIKRSILVNRWYRGDRNERLFRKARNYGCNN
jgi:hypothetical protein